jgi:hypothetical protein
MALLLRIGFGTEVLIYGYLVLGSVVRKIASKACYYELIHMRGLFAKAS